MRKKILFLAGMMACCSLAGAQEISKTWVADKGNGTYQNPVLHADYSDPDVCAAGDDFYMTASSFNCIPGIPILHSNDLVNWSLVNYALPIQEPEEFFDKAQHGKGVWAPAIRFHNGEFYIYWGDPDYGIYMIKAKDPKGRWSKPVLVKAGKGMIDPTPLWDEDGKVYLVHAYAGSRSGVNSIVVICELNAEGTEVISDPVMVFDGNDGKNHTVEGPKLYKRNGYYYIFAPAGGVATGWQLVLRSKNIYGPYESKIVMAQGKTNINGPHQGGWVDTNTGESWFVHFQDKGAYGRVIHLNPMTWVNDWPVIGVDKDEDGCGEPVTTYKKPNVGKTYPIATPPESDEFNTRHLGLQWQWHANKKDTYGFTTDLGYIRHYAGAHVQSVVVSHSYLNNRNTKYRQNDESIPENLMLRLRSTEQETKFRFENNSSFRNWKVNLGLNLDYSQYTNTTFQKAYTNQAQTFDYHTYLGMMRWGLFGTISYSSMDERFTASLGLRADANNYSSAMKSLSDQLSPRISLSYQLADHWFLSGNAGLYYQLPPYTALGFKDNNGTYVNKYNLRYMKVSQESLGISWRKGDTFEVSVEGFYKDYDKIPLSVVDGIPLTCKGNDYGVIGNELLTSTAQGRSYGAEILVKWLIAKKLNLASSFTLFKSEYRNDKESEYIASAWDNRYIFNLRGTYNLPRQWSVGMKVSCIGGAPYTPYDEEKSSLVSAWDAQGKAYYDYSKYNKERLPAFAQVDLRIDKTFYLKHCMLGFYLDLQNITVSKLKQQDVLMSTGIIENPEAPADSQHYKMKRLKQSSGTLLPTLGITFEY